MTSIDFVNKLAWPTDLHKSIIEKLKEQTLPLIIYGGGSLSVSVRRLLEKENIKITAYWVDGAEQNEMREGLPVLKIEQIHEQYGDVNVVLGHSKYELSDNIKKTYSFIKNVFCLVNVCYGRWKGIDADFVRSHVEDYVRTVNLVGDTKSRECVLAYLNCKMTEDFRYILPLLDERVSYFNNPFWIVGDTEEYADIGAYNGDTIKEFLQAVNNHYKTIYAVEPEEKNYLELENYIKENNVNNIHTYRVGCWNSKTVLTFQESDESSSITSGMGIKVSAVPLDEILENRGVTILKINYLEGVVECLEGAEHLLKNQQPKLIITVGFDEWGIIKIPQLVKKINPQYKIYLRYAAAMPARLIMFAC